jgi:hypothetical protein
LLTSQKKICGLFLISDFEDHQIWLNVLINDQHLSNITKLKKKYKVEENIVWGILCEFLKFFLHPSIISLLISKILNNFLFLH